jgi:predicted dehydrogenase
MVLEHRIGEYVDQLGRSACRHRSALERKTMTGVGVIGCGYWGPNPARVLSQQKDCTLQATCGSNPRGLELARLPHPACATTSAPAHVIDQPGVNRIVVATAVNTHFKLAREALGRGEDALVCKPMTETAAQAGKLLGFAQDINRIHAVNHTFLYMGAACGREVSSMPY